MKKNKIILALIVTIAVLLVAAAVVSALFLRNNDTERPLSATELLDLGEKYLLEMDYEKALVQFLKVIEIEPMNPRAYISAAKTYVALGQIDNAINILNRGLESTGDEEIKKMLEDLIPIEPEDTIIEPEDTIDELTSEQLEMLSELKAALTTEDYVSAFNIGRRDTYKQVAVQAKDNSSLISYYDSGTWLLVYPSGYAYCGDIKDNLRNGMGVWFNPFSVNGEYEYYKGQWVNDLPNGQGMRFLYFTTGAYHEDIGNFSDGSYDGIFSATRRYDNGKVCNFTLTYVRGVPQKMPNSEGEVYELYVVAICNNCGAKYILGERQKMQSVYPFGSWEDALPLWD